MKKLSHFLFAILSFVLFGCTEPEMSENVVIQNSGYTKVEQEAIQLVKSFKSKQDSQTKSITFDEDIKILDIKSNTYTIDESNITKLKSASGVTDSINPVFELYTISFEKEGKRGFSIVAPDERLSSVYAYTENGSILDTTFNIGLAITLQNIPEAAKAHLNYYYLPSKKLTKASDQVYLDIDPLVKTAWGQGDPYNLDCPPGDGCSHTLAGCGSIALAQVLAAQNIKSASKMAILILLR